MQPNLFDSELARKLYAKPWNIEAFRLDALVE